MTAKEEIALEWEKCKNFCYFYNNYTTIPEELWNAVNEQFNKNNDIKKNFIKNTVDKIVLPKFLKKK